MKGKEKKVNNVYEYSKDWTAHDFYGKYHLHQIKNPVPIPGTQIKLEQEHLQKKEKDINRFIHAREQKKIETQKLMDLKKQSSEFTTRVHVHTLIGEPSDQAEKILQENYELATTEVVFPDSQLAIDRFMKNVYLGRAHYVSYAVTTGYQSINWKSTNDSLGYTALHVAIVKGHVEVVSELLKYNADPNICSDIGNFPLHDCWVFWKAPVKKDFRIQQGQKTCEIIRLLCGYGANPDCRMSSDGSTALHIACRLGPVHAVVLLLGFKADYMARNKRGQTCLDVAIEFENIDIQRILEYWNGIRTQLVHVDFIIQWKIFLNDPEAAISSVNDQSVEKIMFELKMRENMRKQDVRLAGGMNNFPVDDEFLLQCKLERNFIEKLKNQNKYYKDNEDNGSGSVNGNNLDTQRDGSVTNRSITSTITDATNPTIESNNAINSGQATQRTDTTYEPGSWQSLTGFGKRKTTTSTSSKKKRLPPVREYYLKILAANSPEIPKQFNSKIREKSLIARLPSKGVIEEEEGEGGEVIVGEEDNDEEKEDVVEESKEQSEQKTNNIEDQSQSQTESNNNNNNSNGNGNSEEFLNDLNSMSSLFAGEEPKKPTIDKPQTSRLYQRRKVLADRIGMDGKFESHTLRPCTSSVLHISRRTDEAPLEKTAEEQSLLRYLTTTSKQRKLIALNAIEMNNKDKERFELMNSIKATKNVTNFGKYVGVDNYNYFVKPTERQLLYDRVIDDNQKNSMSILSTEQNTISIKDTETKYNKQNTSFKTKGSKIDMNTEENRSLFVAKELLPPNKEIKSLEELKQRLQTELHDLNTTSSANFEVMSQTSTSESNHSSEIISITDLNEKEKHAMELMEYEKKKRNQVNYGAGRLQSTHRVKKIVEEPWSKVKGRYKVAVNI